MALELAHKMYSDVLSKYPLLNPEEEINIIKAAKAGDKNAFDTLILSNIRLVLDIAKRYSNRGLSDEELIQEGIEGLIKAYEKFDMTFTNRYATYATMWVEHYIRLAVNNYSTVIRIPNKLRSKLVKLREKLKLDINIDYATLAKDLGISVWRLKALIPYVTATTSLDSKLSEDGATMHEFIADENTYDDSLNRIALKQMLDKANLKDRELEVLQALFYDDVKASDFVEVLGVTHARVYVIRNNALTKLRRYK